MGPGSGQPEQLEELSGTLLEDSRAPIKDNGMPLAYTLSVGLSLFVITGLVLIIAVELDQIGVNVQDLSRVIGQVLTPAGL